VKILSNGTQILGEKNTVNGKMASISKSWKKIDYNVAKCIFEVNFFAIFYHTTGIGSANFRGKDFSLIPIISRSCIQD